MAHLTQEAGRLAQPISDLEDVRAAMEVLRRVRDMEIDTDRAIEPIEVSVALGRVLGDISQFMFHFGAIGKVWG